MKLTTHLLFRRIQKNLSLNSHINQISFLMNHFKMIKFIFFGSIQWTQYFIMIHNYFMKIFYFLHIIQFNDQQFRCSSFIMKLKAYFNFIFMTSTRLSQRFPLRPSAQRSPSPDMNGRSSIINTASPKVQKEHLLSKKEKDQSIIKIKEENKKLKEEMKHILNKNKSIQEPKEEDRKEIAKEEMSKSMIQSRFETGQSQKKFNDRQTQKQSYIRQSNSQIQISTVNFAVVKQQLGIFIKQRESKLFDRISQLEHRLKLSEENQRTLQQKVKEYKSDLQTSIKRRINFDASPIHSSRNRQQNTPSPIQLNTTPIKFSQNHRDAIHELQSQLSGAQSTIRRLQTILQTEQKSYSSLKFQTERKQIVISELKREMSNMKSAAKELNEKRELSERKESSQKRELKLFYEKEINKLNSLIQDLQEKLLNKEKETRELHRANSSLKITLAEQKQQEINYLKQLMQVQKDQVKRLSQELNKAFQSQITQDEEERLKTQAYMQNLHTKLQQISKKARDYESYIQQTKIYIQTLESQLKKLEETHSGCDKKIYNLKIENQKLALSFDKVREELDQIGIINSKLSQQKNQVQSLTLQLTEALKNLEITKDEHKEQSLSFLNQVKAIRSFTQSIHIEESQAKSNIENYNNQIESLTLGHKQQILKLQSVIHSTEKEKQKLQVIISNLENQNAALKQQIQALNSSIRIYSKPIPHKEISYSEIESIMLKQESSPNLRVENANRILNGVSTRLNKLYDEINKNRE